MSQSIKVRALKYHTFAGKEYQAGDSYDVSGDDAQTAEQYVTTMALIGFVGQPDEGADAKAAEARSKKYETRDLKAKR